MAEMDRLRSMVIDLLITLAIVAFILAICVLISSINARKERKLRAQLIDSIVSSGRSIPWREAIERIGRGDGLVVVQWEPVLGSVWWVQDGSGIEAAEEMDIQEMSDWGALLVFDIPAGLGTGKSLATTFGDRMVLIDYGVLTSTSYRGGKSTRAMEPIAPEFPRRGTDLH